MFLQCFFHHATRLSVPPSQQRDACPPLIWKAIEWGCPSPSSKWAGLRIAVQLPWGENELKITCRSGISPRAVLNFIEILWEEERDEFKLFFLSLSLSLSSITSPSPPTHTHYHSPWFLQLNLAVLISTVTCALAANSICIVSLPYHHQFCIVINITFAVTQVLCKLLCFIS